jgi:hypothetical protein
MRREEIFKRIKVEQKHASEIETCTIANPFASVEFERREGLDELAQASSDSESDDGEPQNEPTCQAE